MEPRTRRIALAVTVVAIVGAIWTLSTLEQATQAPAAPANLPADEARLAAAPGFGSASSWLDTPGNRSLDLASLRGGIVLVDFWTYSCINCIHTLPHLTALYDAYRSYNFTIVGVHTPEFGFETHRDNVAKAIAEHGIHYPVVQDNGQAIWNGYGNQYWPAHYLIDQYGRIRATHFGEGAYAQTEDAVRSLLLAIHPGAHLPPKVEPLPDVGQGGASPELYASSGRSALGNPEGQQQGQTTTYAQPEQLAPDRIYVVGAWRDAGDSLVAAGNGTVEVLFHGGAANIVLGAAPGCLPLTLDGAPPTAADAGPAVDLARHCLRVDGSDSYDFYAGANAAHRLDLQVPAGTALYTLDFTG